MSFSEDYAGALLAIGVVISIILLILVIMVSWHSAAYILDWVNAPQNEDRYWMQGLIMIVIAVILSSGLKIRVK